MFAIRSSYHSVLFFVLFSLELRSATIVRRSCTTRCAFQMNFDDQFERPLNCSEQTLSYACIVRITILYNTRQVFIYFRTTGFEQNENELTLYTIQQVSHIFPRNYTSYAIIFACFFADDCDWTYTRDIIDQFTRVNYTLMFNELKSLLYDSSKASVSQCYAENQMIDCNDGICSSIVYESSSSINRSCVDSSDFNVGIDIRRYEELPGSFDEDQNYDFYVCNRNLCNSPTNENSVQSVIRSYSSLLNIPQPSKTALLWQNDLYYYVGLVLLLYFL